MKIKIEPMYLTMLGLDESSETALLKAHLPRAKKIATATNLLNLLGQHHGTARTLTNEDGSLHSTSSDRWFDCDPNRTAHHPHPDFSSNPTARPTLESEVGILSQEMVHGLNGYVCSYQRIRLYIPLDPSTKVTAVCSAGGGVYPDRAVPTAVYRVEIETV